MPEIQNPELVQKIVRRYGLRGYPGPGFLSPEIVPVTIVDQITEERWEKPFVGGYHQAGVVAEFTSIQLYNPANSGIIIFLDKIIIHVETLNSSLRVTLSRDSENPFTGTARPVYETVDERFEGALTACKLYTGTAAGLVGYNFITNWNTPGPYPLELPYVCTPGSGIYVQHGIANKWMAATFVWRERAHEVDDVR